MYHIVHIRTHACRYIVHSQTDTVPPSIACVRTHRLFLCVNVFSTHSQLFNCSMSLVPTPNSSCMLISPLLTAHGRPDSAHKKAHTQDLSFAALEAMSALVCSGPVFDPRGLGPSGYMYKWLRSMLSSKDARIQTLGRKTLQQLLQNNTGISLLLNWVVDHCFDQDQTAAQLYFHALSNTLSSM